LDERLHKFSQVSALVYSLYHDDKTTNILAFENLWTALTQRVLERLVHAPSNPAVAGHNVSMWFVGCCAVVWAARVEAPAVAAPLV